MNAQPPPPPPPPASPQPGGAPAPPQPPAYPAQPGGTPEKGNGGLRVLAAIGVVVLAFVALVGFIAFADIASTDTCDSVRDGTGQLNDDLECYDGSSGLKTIVTAMGFLGSALIAVAAVMSLMFAIRGRGGRPLLMVLGAGVVLFGLSLLIG